MSNKRKRFRVSPRRAIKKMRAEQKTKRCQSCGTVGVWEMRAVLGPDREERFGFVCGWCGSPKMPGEVLWSVKV